MFSERGLDSGQLYQPELNHRQVQHTYLNHGRSTKTGFQRAMKICHCDPRGYELFSNNNLISIHWYSVRALPEDDSAATVSDAMAMTSLKSHSKLKLKSVSSLVDRESYIKDRMATHVTGFVFKRALEFFNYEWVDESGTVVPGETNPTPADLCAFAELFEGIHIERPEGFKAFLKEFNMDPVFRYKDEYGHFANVRMFSDLLRALVPMRPGIFDGQHRWMLLALFSHGHCDPRAVIPLERSASLDEIPEVFLTTYDKWQCWIPDMMMAVGHPSNPELSTDPMKLHKLLSEYGEDVTKAQGLSIDPNYTTVSNIVTEAFENRWDKLNMREMNFSNYWNQKQRTTSHSKISKNLKEAYALINLAVRANPLIGDLIRAGVESSKSHELAWNTIEKATQDAFVKYHRWVGKSNQNPNSRTGTPVKYACYLSLLKPMCHDLTLIQKVDQFFREPMPVHAQIVRTPELIMSACTTVEYLWDYVLRPLSATKSHIKERILVEYKIIHLLTTEDDNPAVEEQHSNYMQRVRERYGPSTLASIVKDHSGIVFPTNPNVNLDGKKMDLPCSPLTSKLEFAFYASMIRQFFETVLEYGFDPDFKTDLNADTRANEKLRLYL